MKKTSILEAPKRQGFYSATLASGTVLIAEWREYSKEQGKCWWQYVTDDPTVEKTRELLEDVVAFEAVPPKDVEAFLARHKTQAEILDAAYQLYLRDVSVHRYDCPIPPERQLQIGDDLELGMLPEVKVVELRDEGRVVIYSFTDIDHNYGRPINKGTAYRACHWTEVVPKKYIQKTAKVRRSRIADVYRTSSLDSLVNRMLNGVDDHPDYQRGYAWSASDKERFLDSLFAGRDIGRFLFVKQPYPHAIQLLDGKQRLNCLLEFVTSQFAHQGIYWHEMSPGDRDRVENQSVQYADLPTEAYSREDLLQIFLDVNAAGVPQTEEHLAFVRQQLADEKAKNQG